MISSSFKAIFIILISSSSSSSPNLSPQAVVDASPLPSNALNRWRSMGESSPAFVRGGETASAVATVSRSSGGKIVMDSTGTGSHSRGKPRKRRKKKTSTKRKQTMKSTNSIPSSSSSSKPKAKPVEKPKTTDSTAATKFLPPVTKDTTPIANANYANPESTTTNNNTNSKKPPSHDQMPSIFESEESIYDKYAACLAATEGLRRIRDSKLQENKKFRTAVNIDADKYGGWKSLLKGGDKGKDEKDGSGGINNTGDSDDASLSSSSDPSLQKEGYKRACAEYVFNSSKVVKALGLSVSQFNQLGREIKKNKSLREKVIEQAYLYRMAATINMDKIPIIQDPNSKKLLQSTKRRRVQMFVRSITEIEELRSEQMERLKRALNIDKLPSDINLCDPNVLPLLNPKVKAVIEAFPLQAEVIVKKYGLNSDEFNQMLEETRGNPVFRWRVERFKKNSDTMGQKQKKDGKTKNQFGELGEI